MGKRKNLLSINLNSIYIISSIDILLVTTFISLEFSARFRNSKWQNLGYGGFFFFQILDGCLEYACVMHICLCRSHDLSTCYGNRY